MPNTVYVYDKNNGKIKYTVDQTHDMDIKQFEDSGETFFVGPAGAKISGTYVKKDSNSGAPVGISRIEHMSFVNINKHVIVANGTDEAVISGLRSGMKININDEHSYTVNEETGTTLEVSCNNYSYSPQHNHMKIYMKAYGCYDSVLKIQVIRED